MANASNDWKSPPFPTPDTKDAIHTFWIGPRPAYINLCYRTLEHHNPRLHIHATSLDPYILRDYDLDWVSTLRPAHQADLYRVAVLKAGGGMWIDSDFIHMQPMAPLFRASERENKFFYYRDRWQATNGILLSPPGHSIIEEWHRKNIVVAKNHMRMGTKPMDIPWCSFGADQLKVCLGVAVEPSADLGWDRVQLIDYHNSDRFFQTTQLPEKSWPACYGYMLFNTTGIPDWFRSLSEDEILNGPWLISYLFRVSLGLQKHEDPTAWTPTPPTSPS